ncbi:hypothetical protein F5888DRAFT_1800383 [Russula emetica]|nr:hypothetical protein F5888DRAFT_1800383 [Russula emetica]
MSTPDVLSSSLLTLTSLGTGYKIFLIRVTHPTKMRRYDIISGILLILSIIDFALAAPVLVQEKRPAGIDVAHIPKGVITVLGKRGPGDDELEKLAEEYLKTGGKPVDSSDAQALSSSAPSGSAPPGPDHGSTNVVQSPAPNPASSTANPDPLIEGPSSTAALQGDDAVHIPSLTEYGSDHELTGAHAPLPNLNPNPKKRPLTDPDQDFDWNYWMNKVNKEDPPRPRPAPPKEFGQTHEYQPEVEHVQQPSPGTSSPGTSTDEEFGWINFDDFPTILRPGPASSESPKEIAGQAHEHQVEEHTQQPNSGQSADPNFDWNYWMYSEDPLVPPSRPSSSSKPSIPESSNPGTSNPSLPTEPELRPDDQSLSADSQMDDVQAAIYAAKGKGKQLRRISGTARDVGNVAQRELQLAETA